MTKTKELLLNEIERIPEPILDEILDFIHFLKGKIEKEKFGITIASESSLKIEFNGIEKNIDFGNDLMYIETSKSGKCAYIPMNSIVKETLRNLSPIYELQDGKTVISELDNALVN